MDPGLFLAAALAGAIIVLTPGPAVLALIGIGAAQGRRAGASFLFGHLAGDLVWTVLALIALVWAHVVSPEFFRVLAFVCAFYLGWLGLRAMFHRPRDEDGPSGPEVRRPYLRGLMFGFTNPKSYPVTLSVMAALLSGHVAKVNAANVGIVLAACFAGFFVADLVLIWLVGLRLVRSFYRRHELWVRRATGAMFVAFALSTLYQAVIGNSSG